MRRFLLTRRAALAAMGLVASTMFAGHAPAWAQDKPPVVVSINADFSSIDPHRIYSGGDYAFIGNVFESLYGRAEDGSLEPVLATSHKISEDGLTYSFELRKGVKFHNGDPFTAADVRYSWERATNPEIKNPRQAVLAANIADIEIVDDFNVNIRLKKPDGAFMNNLGAYWHIVPKKYAESVSPEEFGKKPVGTGPFKFVERATEDYVKLTSFADHWGRVPAIGDLTFKVIPDAQTRIAQLRAGEVDIATAVPAVVASRYKDGTDIKIVTGSSFRNIWFMFSSFSANKDIANVEVRKALNMAIDKATLMKAATFGFATENKIACHPSMIGCDVEVQPYAYDPDKAKAMLEAAGFDFSKPLKIVVPASDDNPTIAQGIGQFFQRIGVQTKLEMMENGAYVAMTSAKPKDASVDIIMEGYPDYNQDPSGRLRRLLYTGETISFVSDKELDANIDQLTGLAKEDERLAQIRKLFQMVHDKVSMINLWSADLIYATTNKIDWKPPVSAWPVFWNVKKSA